MRRNLFVQGRQFHVIPVDCRQILMPTGDCMVIPTLERNIDLPGKHGGRECLTTAISPYETTSTRCGFKVNPHSDPPKCTGKKPVRKKSQRRNRKQQQVFPDGPSSRKQTEILQKKDCRHDFPDLTVGWRKEIGIRGSIDRKHVHPNPGLFSGKIIIGKNGARIDNLCEGTESPAMDARRVYGVNGRMVESNEAIIIRTRHHDVDVVVPRNETLVANRSKKRSSRERIPQVVRDAKRVEIFEDFQFDSMQFFE